MSSTLSALSSCVSASNWRLSNSHSFVSTPSLSSHVCNAAPYGKPYRAMALSARMAKNIPPKDHPNSRAVCLFAHNAVTTDLNKGSVSYAYALLLSRKSTRRNLEPMELHRPAVGPERMDSAARLAKGRAGFPVPSVAFRTKSQVGVPPTWLFYCNPTRGNAWRMARLWVLWARRNVRFRSLADSGSHVCFAPESVH